MEDGEASIGLIAAQNRLSSDVSEQPRIESFEVEEVTEDPGANENSAVKFYVIAIFLSSLMMAGSKLAMKDADQYIVMLARMLATFFLSTLWLVYNRVDHLFWGAPEVRLLVFARGFLGTLILALLYYAVQYMPLPDYSVINFLSPLLTAVAAHYILGEPYSWMQAVGSIISFAGVLVITRPSFIFGHVELPEGVTPRQHTMAVICVLLSDVLTTGTFLVLRTVGNRVSAHAIVTQYALQTCVLSLGVLLFKVTYWKEAVAFPTKWLTWLTLVFISVVGFGFQFLINHAMARGRSSVLSQFDYTSLIYMMIWQLTLFGTLPDGISIAGGLLIIVGVVCSSYFQPK